MAELPLKLDKLQDALRRKISQLGGDPNVVEFILGRYGCLSDPLTDTRPPPFKTWEYWTPARQKQIKRNLKRQFPSDWKQRWKELQSEAKRYEAPKLQQGLLSIEVIRPKPAHAPFAIDYWMAVCDVKTYFTRIAKRPHWNLIQEIFFPGKTAWYVQSEWVRRKKHFARFDNEGRLTRLLHFYTKYESVFAKVLQTRISILVTPHREEFERLAASQKPEELFS